ncbi:MAG: sigma factor-like helix-turn-helix DNA-binding protein [Thermoguttaceae bacterium]
MPDTDLEDGQENTPAEIGKCLRLTREWVRQIPNKALRKLRCRPEEIKTDFDQIRAWAGKVRGTKGACEIFGELHKRTKSMPVVRRRFFIAVAPPLTNNPSVLRVVRIVPNLVCFYPKKVRKIG